MDLLDELLDSYQQTSGITELLDWQRECLNQEDVFVDGRNIVFAAPTSAGKTLVAELFLLARMIRNRRKALFILPFISVAREKLISMQRSFRPYGVRVEGYMGSMNAAGGIESWDVAVCTLEKANGLVNRLVSEEGAISQLDTIVVDELHCLGDATRGYLLELLLSKMRYIASQNGNSLQIIGMSATLPNIESLGSWLNARVYKTDTRPIPLTEMLQIGNERYDSGLRRIDSLPEDLQFGTDGNSVLIGTCLESVLAGHGVLLFCSTKKWTEDVARRIASAFFQILSVKDNDPDAGKVSLSKRLKAVIQKDKLESFLNLAKDLCGGSMDANLCKLLPYGVSFHHGGLTMEEREQIERAFAFGFVRVLTATSTLSSGVNLPARRVIIRAPWVNVRGPTLTPDVYRQMVGRAGRKGIDTCGESVLMCSSTDAREQKRGRELIGAPLTEVRSCLFSGEISRSLKKTVLEAVAANLATTRAEVEHYLSFTLYAAQYRESGKADGLPSDFKQSLVDCLDFLEKEQFLGRDENEKLIPTQLAQAALSSSLGPDEALLVLRDLNQSRQRGIVLTTDLHLVYLVTPCSMAASWPRMNWSLLYGVWSRLSEEARRIATVLGVNEGFVSSVANGTGAVNVETNVRHRRSYAVLTRFLTALVLHDLIEESSIAEVAGKYDVNRGFVQSLQNQAATYSGMIVSFCDRLGWQHLRALLSGMAERLQFGVRRELTELVRIDGIDARRARALHAAGLDTVAHLATGMPQRIAGALRSALPFDATGHVARQWLAGYPDMLLDAAVRLVIERARVQFAEGLRNNGVTADVVHRMLDGGSAEPGIQRARDDSAIATSVSSVSSRPQPVEEDQRQGTPAPRVPTVQGEVPVKLEAPDSYQQEPDPVENRSTGRLYPRLELPDDSRSPGIATDSTQSHADGVGVTVSPSPPEDGEQDLFEESSPNIGETVTTSPLAGLTRDLSQVSLSPNTPNIVRTTSNGRFVEITAGRPRGRVVEKSLLGELMDLSEEMNEAVEVGEDVVKLESSSQHAKRNTSLNTSDFELLQFLKNEKINTSRGLNDSDTLLMQLVNDNTVVPETNVDEVVGPSTSGETGNTISPNKRRRIRQMTRTSGQDASPSPVVRKKQATRDRCAVVVKMEPETGEATDCSQSDVIPSSPPKRGTPLKNKVSSLGSACLTSPTASVCGLRRVRTNNEPGVPGETPRSSRQSSEHDKTFKAYRMRDETASVRRFESFKKLWQEAPQFSMCLCLQSAGSKGYAVKSRKLVLAGIAVCISLGTVHYLSLSGVTTPEAEVMFILGLICKSNKRCISYDGKYLRYFLLDIVEDDSLNLRLQCCKTALWLLEGDNTILDVTHMSTKYVTHLYDFISEKPYPSDNSSSDSASAIAWLAHSAWIQSFEKKLREETLWSSFTNIETSIHRCVVSMERRGVQFDRRACDEFIAQLQKQLEQLEARAFTLARRRFSLSSPAEISRILFQELRLPPDGVGPCAAVQQMRKAKGGLKTHYSTSKQVLERLVPLHELPRVILEWRKAHCSLSKTLHPLKRVFDRSSRDGRLHGVYDLLTATGRMIMYEPSLQTIPRDFELSPLEGEDGGLDEKSVVALRSLFVAPEGKVLFAADYCQLELRILAHLSQDKALLNALKSETDIFREIACKWLDLASPAAVTSTQRQHAKQICYGLIYGMGLRQLALQLNVDENTAREFSSSFSKNFPSVIAFIRDVGEKCRRNRHVEVISGRKRFLPKIRDCTPAVRQHAERQAVNTTVQGSAADLFKRALIAIHERLHLDEHTDCFIVLQLHDEVMLEVPQRKLRTVARLVQECMTTAWELNGVDLEVKLQCGKSWGAMQEMKL